METVSSFLLSQMKTVSVNSAAATLVMTTMDTILSTTVGTATEGSVTMTGEEYLEAITIFVQILQMDMSSSSIIAQSLSLTSVATTLTATQVTSITLVKTTLTTVISRLSLIIAGLQEDFKTQTGSEATTIQITSGSTSVTTTEEASSSILISLQSLTVNEKSITEVKTLLTSLASSGSVTSEGGEQIAGDVFILRLEEFLAIVETDFTSVGITVFSLSLTQITVTLTEAEKTTVTTFQETVTLLLTKISLAITFYKSEFKTLTGVEATDDQISAGDATKTLTVVSEENEAKLQALSDNKDSVAETSMLCGRIADDPIGATASGTVEMTTQELCELVMSFITLISEDYLSTEATALMSQIEAAKLTKELTYEEYVMVIQTVTQLDILVVEISISIQVISIQYLVITGVEIVIETPGGGSPGGAGGSGGDGGTAGGEGGGAGEGDGPGGDGPGGDGGTAGGEGGAGGEGDGP